MEEGLKFEERGRLFIKITGFIPMLHREVLNMAKSGVSYIDIIEWVKLHEPKAKLYSNTKYGGKVYEDFKKYFVLSKNVFLQDHHMKYQVQHYVCYMKQ